MPAGPYAVNGVPLRRVNQAFVIATSTVVDISKVKLPATVNDSFFTAEKKAARAEHKKAFFEVAAETVALPEEKKAIQKAVDDAIAVKADQKAYLKAAFSLSKGDKPHAMAF